MVLSTRGSLFTGEWIAHVHGKAGVATYRKGDRLMFRALVPMLMMGILTYFLFRSGVQTTGFVGAGAGCVVMALGFWCMRDVFSLEAAADQHSALRWGVRVVALSSLIDTIVGRAPSLSSEDIRRYTGRLEGFNIAVASRPARELRGRLRTSRGVLFTRVAHPGFVRIALTRSSR